MKKYKKIIVVVFIIILILVLRYIFINSNFYKSKSLYLYPIKTNQTSNNYIFDEYYNHIGIMFYEGTEEVVKIPEKINNKPVYSIDDSAFYGNAKMKKVIIPKYVIRIGHQTFIGNNKLEEVYLPDNITDIGPFSFDVCPKLKKIYIKKGSKTEKTLKETKFYKYKVYK